MVTALTIEYLFPKLFDKQASQRALFSQKIDTGIVR